MFYYILKTAGRISEWPEAIRVVSFAPMKQERESKYQKSSLTVIDGIENAEKGMQGWN